MTPRHVKLAALTGLVLGLCSSAAAGAGGPSITQVTATPADPTGTTPFTITVTGSASSGDSLTVIVDPASAPCPGNPSADTGNPTWIPASPESGNFSATSQPRGLEHGSYTICSWLTNSSGTAVATDQTALTVTNPDTITVSTPSATVTDGSAAAVSVSGVADVQQPQVFVTRKPASGGTCAPSPAADSGTPVAGYNPAPVQFGSFSSSSSPYLGAGPQGRDQAPPGRYLLCAWLLDGAATQAPALAGPASTVVTLTAPTGTLAYSLPELVTAGTRFTVVTDVSTSAADVSLFLSVKPLQPSSGGCSAPRAGARLIVSGSKQPSMRTEAVLRHRGVFLACTWLAWPHGTIDGPFPVRLVVVGPRQQPVAYTGITSQQLPAPASRNPFAFDLIDGQVVNLRYWARYTCTAPHRPTTHPVYSTSVPVFGLASGSQIQVVYIRGSDRASISGSLFGAGEGAIGTLTESYASGQYTCRAGPIQFTALRG